MLFWKPLKVGFLSQELLIVKLKINSEFKALLNNSREDTEFFVQR